MIYSEKINRAICFAYEAHAGQTDKSGLPYFTHPYHLAEQMTDEASVIAALLHDVIEDTEYTAADLKKMDFGDEVIEAVTLLTHNEGEDYLDYVRKIKENPIARKVKIADLLHNTDLTRLTEVNEWILKKIETCYKPALKILQEGDE